MLQGCFKLEIILYSGKTVQYRIRMLEMIDTPILQTSRLILRPLKMSDAKRVQLLAGDKEVARTTLLIPHPYPNGAAEAWIAEQHEKRASREQAVFAAVPRESDELIGCIGLTRSSETGPHAAELGYWIGRPFWNLGYCTEACLAVRTFGFESFGLSRIFAHHLIDNPASGRVMRKLGMRQEGVLRQHVEKWGKLKDIVFFGILKEDLHCL